MPRDLSAGPPQWVLKKNCSMSPRHLALAYSVLCLLSFSVASVFAWNGYWFVVAYSVLEMSAVALALLYYARHAADYEQIALLGDCLLVEQVCGAKCEQTRLDPYWTRIVAPRRSRDLINLESKGVRIAVGCYATEATRRKVAKELQQYLRHSL